MDIKTARIQGNVCLTEADVSLHIQPELYAVLKPYLENAENRNSEPFIPSPTPALDTDCMLEYITGTSRSFLLAHREVQLSAAQLEQFALCLARRRTGLPVAYITGHKEFYGLDFIVTPDVLIPKPDTELLVEHALEEIQRSRNEYTKKVCRIADICTGSGCIAVTVLHESCITSSIECTACDISSKALAVAQKNADTLLSENMRSRISFAQGDLFSALDNHRYTAKGTDAGSPVPPVFNLILSNPPYIPCDEVTELLKDGRNEPRLALDGDTDTGLQEKIPVSHDGLAVIRRLIPQSFGHLAPGGLFLLETGEYNADAAALLMEQAGFSSVTTFRDMAGQLRLTQGRKKKQA